MKYQFDVANTAMVFFLPTWGVMVCQSGSCGPQIRHFLAILGRTNFYGSARGPQESLGFQTNLMS